MRTARILGRDVKICHSNTSEKPSANANEEKSQGVNNNNNNYNSNNIPIVIGAFGTVTKRLLKGLEDLEVGAEWRPSKTRYYWKLPEYWE